LWYGSRANAIERGSGQDARVKRLYRVQEAKWFDENTGENPQPIEVRGINARLMFEDDDHTDMEWLPVVRIGRGTGEEGALPRQDPLFIPPCLVLNGSPILRELMRDLANAVDANRTALLQRITRGGAFSFDTIRGSQFEQILRLRTLGRYSGRLPALVNAPAATPFEVYLELRGLLGELEALYPESEQASVADYDHENPAIAFHELCSKIRRLLPGKAEAAPVLKVPFRLEAGTLVADLTDEHLTRPNEYFLGIRTRQDPKQLSRLVEDPDQFKLMSKSLAKKAIYGVKLSEERFPPYALTGGPDVHYFRLLVGESKRMWEQIQREKAVAVTFPGVETADYAITLWMTLPQMDAGKHDSS
jgi:type VI secretion system ImpJ/VasE family protein